MAQFLIYNISIHWMDRSSKSNPGMTGLERNHFMIDTDSKLSTAQKIQKKDALTLKYNSRPQPGDIAEARRGNKPRGKKEEEDFIFLQVNEIGLKVAEGYCVPLENASGVIIRKRKYFIDMTGLIPDSHKNVTLTESVFNSRLGVKN